MVHGCAGKSRDMQVGAGCAWRYREEQRRAGREVRGAARSAERFYEEQGFVGNCSEVQRGAGRSREEQRGAGKCRNMQVGARCAMVHGGAGKCRNVRGAAWSAGRFFEEQGGGRELQ